MQVCCAVLATAICVRVCVCRRFVLIDLSLTHTHTYTYTSHAHPSYHTSAASHCILRINSIAVMRALALEPCGACLVATVPLLGIAAFVLTAWSETESSHSSKNSHVEHRVIRTRIHMSVMMHSKSGVRGGKSAQ